MTHDRPSHFSLSDEKTPGSLSSISSIADRTLYLFSGWNLLHFTGRHSLLGLGACFLWVAWASCFLVQMLHWLASVVHLTEWHYLWFLLAYPSGDGQMLTLLMNGLQGDFPACSASTTNTLVTWLPLSEPISEVEEAVLSHLLTISEFPTASHHQS